MQLKGQVKTEDDGYLRDKYSFNKESWYFELFVEKDKLMGKLRNYFNMHLTYKS